MLLDEAPLFLFLPSFLSLLLSYCPFLSCCYDRNQSSSDKPDFGVCGCQRWWSEADPRETDTKRIDGGKIRKRNEENNRFCRRNCGHSSRPGNDMWFSEHSFIRSVSLFFSLLHSFFIHYLAGSTNTQLTIKPQQQRACMRAVEQGSPQSQPHHSRISVPEKRRNRRGRRRRKAERTTREWTRKKRNQNTEATKKNTSHRSLIILSSLCLNIAWVLVGSLFLSLFLFYHGSSWEVWQEDLEWLNEVAWQGKDDGELLKDHIRRVEGCKESCMSPFQCKCRLNDYKKERNLFTKSNKENNKKREWNRWVTFSRQQAKNSWSIQTFGNLKQNKKKDN